ncbi:MAG: ATP-binding protein [Polyangiaceae bacterium]
MTSPTPSILPSSRVGESTRAEGADAPPRGNLDEVAERLRFERVLLIVGTLWIAFSASFFLQSRGKAAAACGVAGVLTITLLAWGRRGGAERVRLANHIHQGLATAGLFASNLYTGQSAALGMPFFACVPLAAGYQLGTRAAVVWGVVAGAAVGVMHGVDEWFDVSKGYRFATGETLMNQLGIIVIVVAVVVAARQVTDQREATIRAQAEVLRLRSEELLAARDEAFRAAGAKAEFLAKMSHEIRTPLNGIIGTLTLLRHRHTSGDDRLLMDTMFGSSELLLQLVNDILDYERIDHGRMQLERVPFSIPQCVHTATRTLMPRIEAKGLSLTIDLDEELPEVFGDSLRFQQVLLNLLGNAVKFTDEGEVGVRVAIDAAAAELEVEVWDTGIGLSPEQQSRVFQPFTQAQASTSRLFGGTGLGLAIATQLVELMGGKLTVESALGEGSRFSFRLPVDVQAEPRDAAPETTSSAAPSCGAGASATPSRRVLVAEDNAVNQLVLTRMLELLGHEVDVVGTGDAAVTALLTRRDYALVLMDCQMPVLDGYSATEAIRENERSEHLDPIPIVAVTAHALQHERQRAHDAGMDDYIIKPIQLPVLRDVIERHVLLRDAEVHPRRA